MKTKNNGKMEARAFCGRFNLEAALRALELLWSALDMLGPGLSSELDLPFTGIKMELDIGTGEVRPVVSLTPDWFRSMFGGGRVRYQLHPAGDWVTLEKADHGFLWRTTGSASSVAWDLAALDPDAGAATLRAHKEDLWAAKTRAERALVDDYGPAGILRPLPPASSGSLPLPSAPAGSESLETGARDPAETGTAPESYLVLVEDICPICRWVIGDPLDHEATCQNHPAHEG
jgi:hypothetical protein